MSMPYPHLYSPVRTAIWSVLGILVLLVFGKNFVLIFQPPPDRFNDFLQEWLSAKNYMAGKPVYVPQMESLAWHLPQIEGVDRNFLKWNAHPPGSILIALPFAHMDLFEACFLWNVIGFALFAGTLALWLWDFRIPMPPQTIIALCTLLIVCHPIWLQQNLSQFNFLLFALIILAWIADRRGWFWLAGALVGAATGIKLFPGFLVIYFLGTKRWSAVVSWAAVVAAINLISLAVFGLDAFRTYVEQALPSVELYKSKWHNISIESLLRRLFDPYAGTVVPLVYSPFTAKILIWLARILIVIACARAAYRASSEDDRIRAFTITALGMLLVSPICWTHYMIIVGGALLILWQRLRGFLPRLLFFLSLGVLWTLDTLLPMIRFGKEYIHQINRSTNPPISAQDNLLFFSHLNYALMILFLLALWLPRSERTKAESKSNLDRRLGGIEANQPPP